MLKRKFITYPQEFKEDAVRQYLQGNKSYRQLTEELGIKDAKTLRSWVSKVKNGETLEEGRGKAKGTRRGRPKTNFSSIEEELAYIKSERDFFKALCEAKLGHTWEEEKKTLFKIVNTLRTKYSLSILIHHAGVSKSGYYKWLRNTPSSSDTHLLSHIRAIHSIRPYYGYRRMTVALCREGFRVNHKRVYRLMKTEKIQSVIRRKRRFFGTKGSIVFENRLHRDFTSNTPLKKLVTDITYIPTTDGFIYLSAVQDLFNNEIISYHISSKNDLELVLATLNKLSSTRGAILHSDQGFQYTNKRYQVALQEKNLQGSHSRKGNCLDNAQMESFFSHLKTETFYTKKLYSSAEARRLLDQQIAYYNTERFQKRLGQLSPIEYRKKLAA